MQDNVIIITGSIDILGKDALSVNRAWNIGNPIDRSGAGGPVRERGYGLQQIQSKYQEKSKQYW